MTAILSAYDRAVALVTGCKAQNLTLFFVRVMLASIFWRSGRTKVEAGSLLDI